MKRSALVALGAIFTIALTGCVRMDLNVDVNKDGTGEYSMVLAYNAQYFQEDQIKGDSDRPIKHYDYDGQDWIGYEESKDFDSWEELADGLTDMSGAGADGESSGVFKTVEIDKKSGAFGTTYTFDAETTPVTSGDSSMGSMGSMDSYVKFKINIRMPGKAVEGSLENATLNDDGSVTIDYSADKATTVHIETKESGMLGIILIIGCIVVAVAVVAVVLVIVLKKKKSSAPAVDASYAAPSTPADTYNSGFDIATPSEPAVPAEPVIPAEPVDDTSDPNATL